MPKAHERQRLRRTKAISRLPSGADLCRWSESTLGCNGSSVGLERATVINDRTISDSSESQHESPLTWNKSRRGTFRLLACSGGTFLLPVLYVHGPGGRPCSESRSVPCTRLHLVKADREDRGSSVATRGVCVQAGLRWHACPVLGWEQMERERERSIAQAACSDPPGPPIVCTLTSLCQGEHEKRLKEAPALPHEVIWWGEQQISVSPTKVLSAASVLPKCQVL